MRATRSTWLGVILGAALVLVAALILLPQWPENRAHLESKHLYLQAIGAKQLATGSPNVVLIVFDDLGYGDLGAYGGRAIATPNLDRLAAEGVRFTHAYSSSPYCSASRAGLLTGRYAVRSGIDHVLQAAWTWTDLLLRLGRRQRRLPADEILLSEMLAAAGYRTAAFGKWHLGDHSPSLPQDLGFERFYGLLHSNDQGRPRVFDGRRIAEHHPVDQATLTRRYTERALTFIASSAGEPFFLYLPHTFPHIPLHVDHQRRGRSRGGLYGDVVEELDWSVGRVLEALDRHGVAERTLVIVTSDNGPWFQGSPGGVRGRKLDIFEGGMRVPFLARLPGTLPARAAASTPVVGIDVVPTVLELAGLPPPGDRALDGQSLLPALAGAATDERPVLYFQLGELRALRRGRFKLHDRHGVFFGNPMDWPWGPMKRRGPWLFDLESDPDESYDVSAAYPAVAAELLDELGRVRAALRDNPRGWR